MGEVHTCCSMQPAVLYTIIHKPIPAHLSSGCACLSLRQPLSRRQLLVHRHPLARQLLLAGLCRRRRRVESRAQRCLQPARLAVQSSWSSLSLLLSGGQQLPTVLLRSGHPGVHRPAVGCGSITLRLRGAVSLLHGGNARPPRRAFPAKIQHCTSRADLADHRAACRCAALHMEWGAWMGVAFQGCKQLPSRQHIRQAC